MLDPRAMEALEADSDSDGKDREGPEKVSGMYPKQDPSSPEKLSL